MAKRANLMKNKKKKKILSYKSRSLQVSSSDHKHLVLESYSYLITDKPIADPSIPKEVYDEMEYLFDKSQDEPNLVIDRLEELIEKYPTTPLLYNYISVAYSKIGNSDKLRFYVKKNYENNYNYLFAKLNYAEICMKEGDYDKVPEILNNKFDLKDLYPERDVFHVTEVVSFMGIVGSYFASIGNVGQVEMFYNSLKELAPNHPYVKKLGDFIVINSIREQFNRSIGRY